MNAGFSGSGWLTTARRCRDLPLCRWHSTESGTGPQLELAYYVRGDVDGEGLVNGTDLTAFIENWGNTSTPTRGQGDLTGDGAVDGIDYASVPGNWSSQRVPFLSQPALE